MTQKDVTTQVFSKLGTIPNGANILYVEAPSSWLIYVEVALKHHYCIKIDKKW